MSYFYSPINDAFYPESLKEDYISAKTWPSDVVKVSKKSFEEFSTHRDGFVRTVEGGQLSWKSYEHSSIELSNQEVFWRDCELSRADVELYRVQDSDPKALGSVSDWRAYRRLLRAWPESENFPNKEFRPISPDFKD